MYRSVVGSQLFCAVSDESGYSSGKSCTDDISETGCKAERVEGVMMLTLQKVVCRSLERPFDVGPPLGLLLKLRCL